MSFIYLFHIILIVNVFSYQNNYNKKYKPLIYNKYTKLIKHNNLQQSISNEQYSNKVTELLGKFIQTIRDKNKFDLNEIDWNKKKYRFNNLNNFIKELKSSLIKREWFVTGNVDPSYFSTDFIFEDPDVKVKGIKDYAYGVNKIFNQNISKAEIINIDITSKTSFTITWRLSGGVNIGFGLKIKPYLIYTDFMISKDFLIISQLDRFSIPGYDIILSAVFPFLIPFLTPPAPSAEYLIREMKIKK